jgi:LuxR family maltose regulon positive regulatory protein
MAGGVLARRAWVTGQLRRSEKIVRQVLEQAFAQRGKSPETASIALAVLSQIHLERNELELAQKYLTQALEVDPNPTSSNMLVQIAVQRAKIQMVQGNLAEALANIHAIRALHLRRPSAVWTDQDLLAHEALVYLRMGDLPSAERILNESETIEGHSLSQWVQAEILLAKKQPEAAEKLLGSLVSRYPNGLPLEPLMRTRVLLAQALFDQHKINQALQVMREAIRLAAPERFFRPFLEGGAACPALLALALQTGNLTAEARTFIQELLPLCNHGGREPQLSQAEIEALSTSASISPREQEVLHMISLGYSNCELAQKLSISESTVKTHLSNIYKKLDVTSRVQAVASAKELGVIP